MSQRAGVFHLVRYHILELSEVFSECHGEFVCFGLVSSLVCPGALRVQYFIVDTRAACRDMKPEYRVLSHWCIVKFTCKSGFEHGARMVDIHALSETIGPATPACIDQPAINIVFTYFFTQQGVVNTWVKRHERCAKAGAEGCLWFNNTGFRARNLGRVAGQEVVHGLVGSESGQWWHTPEGVACEHNDVFRVACYARIYRARNIRDWIGGARVFGKAVVIKVQVPVAKIDADILDDRAEAAGGFVNQRFFFPGEMYHLGIATAFKIEYTVIPPAVFIVANQSALGIGREGGFAGARKSKKDRYIVPFADVGGAKGLPWRRRL